MKNLMPKTWVAREMCTGGQYILPLCWEMIEINFMLNRHFYVGLIICLIANLVVGLII